MNIESNIALIILNYNKFNLTKRLVDNLEKINFKGRIIIVDNNSKNDSYKILYNTFNSNERIDIIKSEKNGGYACGNNFGIRYAINKYVNIEYIGILNPDVVINDDFSFNDLIEKIDNKDDIAGITPTQIYNNVYSTKYIGWRLPNIISMLELNSYIINKISSRSRYSSLNMLSVENGIAEIDVMPGSFFIMKASIFNKIGFFDENTFLYYEENILAMKVKKMGYKFVVSLDYLYLHDHKDKDTDYKSLKYKMEDYKILRESQRYYINQYGRFNSIQKIVINIVCYLHLYVGIPISYFIKNINKNI